MKNFNPSSGRYIVYQDHSTSGIGGLMDQSTADPITLANLFPQPVIVTTTLYPLTIQISPFESFMPIPAALAQELAAWEAASDEDLDKFEKENL
jgi:hypothetical protein